MVMLNRVRKEVEVNVKDGDVEKVWEWWYDVKFKDLDMFVLVINCYGWLELDWVKGV